jgi:hypothetical protein
VLHQAIDPAENPTAELRPRLDRSQDKLVTLAQVVAKLIHAVELQVAINVDALEDRSLVFLHVATVVTRTTEGLRAVVGGTTNAGLMDAMENVGVDSTTGTCTRKI